MKKTWLILLTGVCQLSFVGACHAAIVASGDCGSDCYWEIDGTTLNIVGTGAMTNYTHTKQDNVGYVPSTPWYAYRSVIDTLQISDGITTMGNHAFEGLSHLSNVTLPEGLTNISTHAFIGVGALQHIDIPSTVTSVGSCAFQDTGLQSIELPEGVTRIDGLAFANTRISDIVIPSTVTVLDNRAFGDATTFDGYYNRIPLAKIYCSETLNTRCEQATEFKESTTVPYQMTADGKYQIGHKTYGSLGDVLTGKYIPKRIYTLEEAQAAAGKVNTVKIRYR
ncbi:MAG: leucine-rich repeat domain-containing protein [Alphaproteobacteria bacterium]|nr:leucine-rich repeat domain-containing protein [Alphaproteobacteria bacterium]